MRSLLGLVLLLAGANAALAPSFAQAPPRLALPPRTDNGNLRAMPEAPGKRVVELQGLDKVTARTQRLMAPVGETTRLGTLEIAVGECLVNIPEASPESVAYLTIVDHKPGQAEEKLFAGWMFASSPSLSALNHGVYDVRVLGCTRSQGSQPPSSR